VRWSALPVVAVVRKGHGGITHSQMETRYEYDVRLFQPLPVKRCFDAGPTCMPHSAIAVRKSLSATERCILAVPVRKWYLPTYM
jgi:hypothetical protein